VQKDAADHAQLFAVRLPFGIEKLQVILSVRIARASERLLDGDDLALELELDAVVQVLGDAVGGIGCGGCGHTAFA
jgi:hypothetical protein